MLLQGSFSCVVERSWIRRNKDRLLGAANRAKEKESKIGQPHRSLTRRWRVLAAEAAVAGVLLNAPIEPGPLCSSPPLSIAT